MTDSRPLNPALADIALRLADVIRSGSGCDRMFAASAVGRLAWHATVAVPALVELIHSDAEARVAAIDAIARIGPSAASVAIPSLIEVLLDPDASQDWSDQHAARALGRMRDSAVVEPLVRALRVKANDPDLPFSIIDALTAPGALSIEAVPLLTENLEVENPLLGPSVTALGSIGVGAVTALPHLRRLLKLELDQALKIQIRDAIRSIDG